MLTSSLPVSIDSLKIRIPLEAGVQLINPQLQQGRRLTHLLDDTTGEMILLADEANSRKAIGQNEVDDGVTVTYQVKRMQHEHEQMTDCLLIGASSKVLGGQYFRGITPKTIQQLHDGILQQGVAAFPFDAMWRHGKATDIDLKQDFIMSLDEWQHYLQELKQGTQLTNKKDRGYLPFGKQGIQWGHREGKSPTNPFVKAYHKGLELQQQSYSFKAAHLQGKDVSNRARVEATAKNNKFLKYYGWTGGNSLQDIVMMPQETKQGILTQMLAKHVQVHSIKPYTNRKPQEGLTMNEYLLLDAIELRMQLGMSKEQAIRQILDRAASKDVKKYHRQKIKELMMKVSENRWKQLAQKMGFQGGISDPPN